MRIHWFRIFLLLSVTAVAQNAHFTGIGYEFRTSGPNKDHVVFVETSLSSRLSIVGHYRFLDKLWDAPSQLFKLPIEGRTFGVDFKTQVFRVNRLSFGLRGGTMAYRAQSYSLGGARKWYVIPTSYLTADYQLYKQLYLGAGTGALWFINPDSYRNHPGAMVEEFFVSIKYRLN